MEISFLKNGALKRNDPSKSFKSLFQFEQIDIEIRGLSSDDRPKFKTQLDSFRAESQENTIRQKEGSFEEMTGADTAFVLFNNCTATGSIAIETTKTVRLFSHTMFLPRIDTTSDSLFDYEIYLCHPVVSILGHS